MFHRSSEYHCRNERDRKRIGYRLIVLLECVFEDVEVQTTV